MQIWFYLIMLSAGEKKVSKHSKHLDLMISWAVTMLNMLLLQDQSSHLLLKIVSNLQKNGQCCSSSPTFHTPVTVFYLINCIIS